MDLSFSMEGDVANVKKLGAEEMKNTTSDLQNGSVCLNFHFLLT